MTNNAIGSFMILFAKDWAEQGARPDFDTKNTSFLKMVSLLHTKGIKNCAFILALHDQSLKGIDPHSPDLTLDQKVRIQIECKVNPWYMFREVARVPAGAGAPPEPLRANRANVCMWWLYYNHITNIQIQPRQTGKSLCADFLNVEQLNFRCQNTPHNLYTKDEKLRRENIQRIKDILDELPRWMDMRGKGDANNFETITINALGNKLNTHLPRSSEREAEKVGRGFTSPTNFYDELPFQTWCGIAYPASISSMDAAVDRAKRAGVDYGVVITTTAGKKDDRDGKFVYKMCVQACTWDERFYDTENQEELEELVRKNSSNGNAVMYSCFNHRQLGYTDEWLRKKMLNSEGGPEAAARDYLCKWTSGTATSPFTPAMSDKIRASEKPVEYLQITDEGYILRWYVEEHKLDSYMASNKFVMGLDTSDATGGDDIGIYVVNTRNAKVVMTAKVNETNIIGFAQWLGDYLCKYKNVILNPERRSTGGTIIDYLLRILPSKGEDPFKRIFNMVVHDSDLDSARYEDVRLGSRRNPDALVRYRKLFGYATSGSGTTARGRLYNDTLFTMIKKLDGQFGDLDVINQLLGLVYKNGRIDHEDGGHDDLVVAMLLSYWFIIYGKNFSHYELSPDDIMTELGAHSELSDIERMQQAEQKVLRERLQYLADKFANERNPIMQTRIEMEMRNLEKKLIMDTGEINTVDQLLRKVKDDKVKTRSDRLRDHRILSHQASVNRHGGVRGIEENPYARYTL